MTFLVDVVAWFADPANWTGGTGLPQRLWLTLKVSGLAVVIATLVAVPTGVALGHVRRGGFLANTLFNIGRAVPSFGIIALALPISIAIGLGLGFWPTFVALFLLALPPMFTNAYTGVRDVDPGAVEAARGMGMTDSQVLVDVELPLAVPIIVTGVRVAALQVVATAPLGALVAYQGLGRYIIDGWARDDYVMLFAGALVVAVLAVIVDQSFSLVERLAAAGRAPTPSAREPVTAEAASAA